MSIKKRSKVATIVAAFALLVLVALVALPSLAAPTGTKYYTFSVSPSSVSAGSSQTFTVTVTNTSPKQSSSNFSSVSVVVPSQFTISGTPTITNASTNGDNSSAVVAINAAGSTNCTAGTGAQVSVCSLAPTKSQKTVVLSIPVTVGDAGLSCGGSTSSDAWIVKPNTGSQLNGNNFDPDPLQPATTKTTITKACNGQITGQVWRDHNGNGQKDSSIEAGQQGWTVAAFQGNNTSPTTTAVSNASGNYTLSGLETGKTYTVCEFAPPSNPAYIGWIQTVPTNAACSALSYSGTAAEKPGYTVSLTAASPSSSGNDFLNVQTVTVPGNTITVTCDPNDPTWPAGGVFTVGDGVNEPFATVTMTPPNNCKPGEYVFESWVDDNGQEVSFHPTFPPTNHLVPITQDVEWVVDGSKAQTTLFYDDGAGKTEAQFCVVDGQGNFSAMPTANDTTCILHTTEDATTSGVDRHDTIVTLVDGKLTLSRGA